MKIDALLEKYFAGETTCKEEEEIRKFFRQTHISKDLEIYRQMFVYFDEEVHQEHPRMQPPSRFTFLRTWGYRAASFAAVCFASWTLYEFMNSPQAEAENYVVVNGHYSSDAEFVEQKAREALDNIGFNDDELQDLIVLDL